LSGLWALVVWNAHGVAALKWRGLEIVRVAVLCGGWGRMRAALAALLLMSAVGAELSFEVGHGLLRTSAFFGGRRED